jgi:tyrosyl-tRNA synthetase
MDVDERLAFIMREPTEEVVTSDELHTLIETKTHPKHYIGLEISGMLHIGSLVMTGLALTLLSF